MRIIYALILGVVASAALFWFAVMMAVGNEYAPVHDPNGETVVIGAIMLAVFSAAFLGSRWVTLPVAIAYVVALIVTPVAAAMAVDMAEGRFPDHMSVSVLFAAQWIAPGLVGFALSRVR